MKQAFSRIILTILSTMILTACGGDGGDGGATPTPPPTPPPTTPPTQPPTTPPTTAYSGMKAGIEPFNEGFTIKRTVRAPIPQTKPVLYMVDMAAYDQTKKPKTYSTFVLPFPLESFCAPGSYDASLAAVNINQDAGLVICHGLDKSLQDLVPQGVPEGYFLVRDSGATQLAFGRIEGGGATPVFPSAYFAGVSNNGDIYFPNESQKRYGGSLIYKFNEFDNEVQPFVEFPVEMDALAVPNRYSFTVLNNNDLVYPVGVDIYRWDESATLINKISAIGLGEFVSKVIFPNTFSAAPYLVAVRTLDGEGLHLIFLGPNETLIAEDSFYLDVPIDELDQLESLAEFYNPETALPPPDEVGTGTEGGTNYDCNTVWTGSSDDIQVSTLCQTACAYSNAGFQEGVDASCRIISGWNATSSCSTVCN